jgi:hypothetical protein
VHVRFRCDPELEPYLPRPEPARRHLPAWLTEMPRRATSDVHGTELRTVKHCPPFIDAMMLGFVMRLPCDVHVAAGRLSWDWDIPAPAVPHHPRSPLSFHDEAQVEGTPLALGRNIVKFNSFWTIELEEGWSLLAMHPANRHDLPFRVLAGLVDADRFSSVGIFFPAEWTDPSFEGTLPKGLPLVQCVPVPRVDLALDYAPFTPEEARAYADLGAELLTTPGVYRRRFRASRSGAAD